MNLLAPSSTFDWIVIGIIAFIALSVVYHLIQWMRSSRNHRDSADHHAISCLESLGLGCFIPCVIVVTLGIVLVW